MSYIYIIFVVSCVFLFALVIFFLVDFVTQRQSGIKEKGGLGFGFVFENIGREERELTWVCLTEACFSTLPLP